MSKKGFMTGVGLILAAAFLGSFPGYSDAQDEVTVNVEGKELGRLNGEVSYILNVTLKNNIDKKLRVDYTVKLMKGSSPLKRHKSSTLLIPNGDSLQSFTDKIKESDWDEVNSFETEWTAQEQK